MAAEAIGTSPRKNIIQIFFVLRTELPGVWFRPVNILENTLWYYFGPCSGCGASDMETIGDFLVGETLTATGRGFTGYLPLNAHSFLFIHDRRSFFDQLLLSLSLRRPFTAFAYLPSQLASSTVLGPSLSLIRRLYPPSSDSQSLHLVQDSSIKHS
jgi:hypothetical protein